MRIHAVIDFMHIYYKYFFQRLNNRLPRLTVETVDNETGDMVEIETSMIYYPLKDIESIRKELEGLGHEVTMSICFDSKSKRTEGASEAAENYKANRVGRLGDEDYGNINTIMSMLKEVGYNIYKEEGYEADDLVNKLIRTYKNCYDYMVVYTNDKDLLINICDNVGVMRYKTGRGYVRIDKGNYEEVLEQEFGVFIPYNALGLYLASVGDTADGIKGIFRFGKAAFKKLITKVACSNKINWAECGDYDKLYEVVEKCSEHLTNEQYKQLTDCFELVRNIGDVEVAEPVKGDSQDNREKTYMKFNMKSLI